MTEQDESKLKQQVVELEARLSETQAVLAAIYNREVDALVVRGAGGEQVFTLEGADQPYRVMVETMAEGALTLAPDGTVLHCNRALTTLLDRSMPEVVGASFAAFVVGEHQATYAALLESTIFRCDLKLTRPGGSGVPVRLSSSPLELVDVPGALCVIVLDLTEQERNFALELEQQAARAREQALRERNEIKTRFLSNMSHEFRSPLNSIFALTSLLLSRGDGELNGEQEKQISYIRKSADALLDLVNDLLDLAKIEAGKIDVRVGQFAAAELFMTLRAMLPPSLVTPTVNLLFEAPAGVPELSTDEAKVSQILRNFIHNALKFTEHGEVRVTARYDQENDFVTFAVRDTGIGIAACDHERIFDEFIQVENPVQSKIKGTGLGLPLCRKLAGLLGGRIELHSEPAAGSRFSLLLPRRYLPPFDERDGEVIIGHHAPKEGGQEIEEKVRQGLAG